MQLLVCFSTAPSHKQDHAEEGEGEEEAHMVAEGGRVAFPWTMGIVIIMLVPMVPVLRLWPTVMLRPIPVWGVVSPAILSTPLLL